ncbi:uncharacterized protein N7484_002061 [Penicillium longicatenatum]|uniref:uncharacterized protein n=1 Tax=Penicillium longicatenatum TaxID=1561947 RepID=UPI00254918DE|nr:uncharacterized protein N7484_002061 [Penicillium longicatenatum]KAJ5658412.1 hypothetical protein N7484_002061 [Penicillium longicatenatum]
MRPSAPIPNNEDSDPTSSSGSSEESDSEDSEDENESIHHEPKATSANKSSIPNVSGRPKPQIHKMQGNSELLARLSAFLPQMKSANEELEKDIAAGKDVVMDDEDENKDYIEMNLGLGVLEEKRDNGGDASGDEADDEAMSGMESGKKAKAGFDDDILEQLMGGKDLDADKPSIEELGQ